MLILQYKWILFFSVYANTNYKSLHLSTVRELLIVSIIVNICNFLAT